MLGEIGIPSIAHMRTAVANVYDHFTWRRKVELMPDRQVAAIYRKWLHEGRFGIVAKKRREQPYHQMDIFEFLPEEKSKLGGQYGRKT